MCIKNVKLEKKNKNCLKFFLALNLQRICTKIFLITLNFLVALILILTNVELGEFMQITNRTIISAGFTETLISNFNSRKKYGMGDNFTRKKREIKKTILVFSNK